MRHVAACPKQAPKAQRSQGPLQYWLIVNSQRLDNPPQIGVSL